MTEVQVSTRQEMLPVFTKQILVFYAFVVVMLNEILKFVGTVKIRGFDSFSTCKSREGGTVLVMTAH